MNDLTAKESILEELIRGGQSRDQERDLHHEQEPSPKATPPPKAKATTGSGEQKVLLIDHSGTALAIMSKLIQKNIPNTQVDIATTAVEAEDFLQQNTYSLMTMSRNLPDVDCRILVEKIRSEMGIRDTPLIVISGEKMGKFEEQEARKYVNGYFDKKLGQQNLVAYIQSFISAEPLKTRHTGHILYVEDSPTAAQAVTSILKSQGHSFELAKDSAQALQLIKQAEEEAATPFDLVMTDIQLEGFMSGHDLIREIRYGIGLGIEQLPIMVTTGTDYSSNPEALKRIYTAGANDVLMKPIDNSTLIARMSNLLALRKQYQQ